MTLQTHDLSYFLGKNIFGDYCSQNTFFYHCLWANTSCVRVKKDKGTDYFLVGNQKRNTSKLKPLYTDFLHSIKLSEYRIGIKFDKDPLTTEQNNYKTKIVNAYIVLELDTRPNYPLNNFRLNNFLFGATNIVKNSDKNKWVHSGYRIAFDGLSTMIFGNDYAKSVVIFVPVIVQHLILIIARIIFECLVKDHFTVLMEAFVH